MKGTQLSTQCSRRLASEFLMIYLLEASLFPHLSANCNVTRPDEALCVGKTIFLRAATERPIGDHSNFAATVVLSTHSLSLVASRSTLFVVHRAISQEPV
jgi:hypothetical protein